MMLDKHDTVEDVSISLSRTTPPFLQQEQAVVQDLELLKLRQKLFRRGLGVGEGAGISTNLIEVLPIENESQAI